MTFCTFLQPASVERRCLLLLLVNYPTAAGVWKMLSRLSDKIKDETGSAERAPTRRDHRQRKTSRLPLGGSYQFFLSGFFLFGLALGGYG